MSKRRTSVRDDPAPRGPHRGSWAGRSREGRLRRALPKAPTELRGHRYRQVTVVAVKAPRVAVAAFANGSFCVIRSGNSAISSGKSTPRWARDISPSRPGFTKGLLL